ncbi:hypothetical protein [Amycolatopsis sp. NBC_01480]|uniref:hypothetical protein n=1 Tax=Amycolatopsis sp. NBC_01480 TaxID=2903562 RepID=UPI002E2A15EB|nr:hypothetical protein [Amycolatopsis sp. NBC_01480]
MIERTRFAGQKPLDVAPGPVVERGAAGRSRCPSSARTSTNVDLAVRWRGGCEPRGLARIPAPVASKNEREKVVRQSAEAVHLVWVGEAGWSRDCWPLSSRRRQAQHGVGGPPAHPDR